MSTIPTKTISPIDLHWIPFDALPIYCVSFSSSSIACASKVNIYYSNLEEPNPNQKSLKFNKEDQIRYLKWGIANPNFLLVICQFHIAIVNTETNEISNFLESPPETTCIDGGWQNDGTFFLLFKGNSKENAIFAEGDLVQVYDSNLSLLYKFNLQKEAIRCATDGNILIFAHSNTCTVGKLSSEEPFFHKIKILHAFPTLISNISIHSDSIIISDNRKVTIWDRDELFPLFTVKIQQENSGYSFSPDNKLGLSFGPEGSFLFVLNEDKSKQKFQKLPNDLELPQIINCASWTINPKTNEYYLFLGHEFTPRTNQLYQVVPCRSCTIIVIPMSSV